ncbi:MAG: tetratricopeptide repeat protein [Pirellula sp.]
MTLKRNHSTSSGTSRIQAPKTQAKRIQLSLGTKILFSLVITILFFVGLECVLALTGPKPVTQLDDPFVGFSARLPLMELSTNELGEQILSTADNKRRWFNAQSFPKSKAKGTIRVFCMGGSTTYGHPYSDSTSFAGWLREFLPIVDPEHGWEVINAGGISYASYRVAALMEELAQYEPDLFIVYSVHNEFLERRTYQNMFDTPAFQLQSQAWLSGTRTWAMADWLIQRVRSSGVRKDSKAGSKADVLKPEVDEMLNHTIGPVDYHRDDLWRANVVRHYESNLRRMIAIANRVGAKIVFITPAANEKDCSPFKSEYDPKLTPADHERLIAIQNRAYQDEHASQPERALEYLKSAIEIDPTFPEYHYRAGHSLLSLQRNAEAFQTFRRALNLDVCPLRAVDEIRQAIDRVASETKVPTVDFEKRLRQLSDLEHGHSIFGDEYFMDHVHPTIDINRWLSLWIIDELQSLGGIRGQSVNSPSIVEQCAVAEEKLLANLDPQSQGIALRNLAKVLHWAGKYDEALRHAQDALVILSDDPESRFVLAGCLRNIGRRDEALVEYEKLFSTGSDYPRAYEPFGHLLAELGRYEQAKAYLILATLHNEKSSNAYFTLGVVHLRLGEFDFAVESLERSNQIFPNDPETLYYLAEAKSKLGQHGDAVTLFQQILGKGVRSADVHYRFGLALLEVNQPAEAVRQFELAIQMEPNWEDVREALKKASEQSNRP